MDGSHSFFGLEKALIPRVVDLFGLASEKRKAASAWSRRNREKEKNPWDRSRGGRERNVTGWRFDRQVDPRERHDTRLSARVLRSVGAITAGCGT
jgi:hypothetical protein